MISAAARGDACPENARCIDRALYYGLYYLYRMYHTGHITKERAAEEKTALLKRYRKDIILQRAMEENAAVRVRLGAYLKQVDFNLCPLARILDGREHSIVTDDGCRDSA